MTIQIGLQVSGGSIRDTMTVCDELSATRWNICRTKMSSVSTEADLESVLTHVMKLCCFLFCCNQTSSAVQRCMSLRCKGKARERENDSTHDMSHTVPYYRNVCFNIYIVMKDTHTHTHFPLTFA